MNLRALLKTVMLDILLEIDEEIIEDLVVDVARWSILHRITFRYDSKIYQTTYRVGATEYQDEGPWDGEDEVECTEVVATEKLVTVYETVQ